MKPCWSVIISASQVYRESARSLPLQRRLLRPLHAVRPVIQVRSRLIQAIECPTLPLKTGVVYPGKFFTRCRDASLLVRELALDEYGPSGCRWVLEGSAKMLFASDPGMFLF